MTYNVFSGTLNLTQSIITDGVCVFLHVDSPYAVIVMMLAT